MTGKAVRGMEGLLPPVSPALANAHLSACAAHSFLFIPWKKTRSLYIFSPKQIESVSVCNASRFYFSVSDSRDVMNS